MLLLALHCASVVVLIIYILSFCGGGGRRDVMHCFNNFWPLGYFFLVMLGYIDLSGYCYGGAVVFVGPYGWSQERKQCLVELVFGL